MSDISNPHNMEIVAFSSTQSLLYDQANSQVFYLYTPTTGALTQLSSSDAKNFYNSAPNQSSGITAWGHTQVEGAQYAKNNTN